MSAELRITSDRELLSLATSVLEGELFRVESLDSNPTVLLAENQYFFVAVVATSTIEQLLIAESLVEAIVGEYLEAADPGPKRWDAYLVLLTQERAPEDDATTRQLFSINYDTSRMRRLARSGVELTLRAVRDSLNPFVSPILLENLAVSMDPLDAMVDELTNRGIDRDVAEKSVVAFRSGVRMGDVL